MSDPKLFTEKHWKSVGKDLRFGAAKWWKRNRDNFVGLTEKEAWEIAQYLKAGRSKKAKIELLKIGSRADFNDFRDKTTADFERIAERRANAIAAAEELGWWAARTVGGAILVAIGL